MVSSDGRYAITYNGEVYNFRALRTELEEEGYRFHGTSDTEVVLAAYRAWGDGCLHRFNGMFALAIYDRGEDERGSSLFLARDRGGEKPLYYALDDVRFQIASELKAIDGSRDLEPCALDHYLALGYVPGALCLASGVAKLAPAHAARLDINRWDLQIWRYWDLPANAPEPGIDGEALTEEAERLLCDAVGSRLVADVPVGVLLSGGLDSSLVTAAAAAASSRPVKTFTISVPGTRYDELPFARRVATHFGTEHHVLSLDRLSLGTVKELAPFVDEPIADSSILPTFLVSRLTRAEVKVALGGDGGDEVFGGYGHYAMALADARRWGWVPLSAWRPIADVAARLPAGIKGRRRLASLRNGPLEQNIWGTNFFDPVLRLRLLCPEARAAAGSALEVPERSLRDRFLVGQSAVDCMSRTDFHGQLAGGYLVKIDRASMAHGLELRMPLLDPQLVEFSFARVPDRWKVGNGVSRRIERALAARMLPPDFELNRKHGFSVPLDEWLRRDRCRIVQEHMDLLPPLIVRREVDGLIAGHMRGRANGARLFALLMLAIAARNNGWS